MSGTRSFRWTHATSVVLVVVSTLVGAVLVDLAFASSASAGQAYVGSSNMCVDYCHRPGTPQNREPNNPVDFVYNQVVAAPTTPWIVGLQETCTLSMWDLGNRLQSRGVVWHFFADTTGAPQTSGCMNGNFGDGLLTIGGNLNNGLAYPLGSGKNMNCVYKQGFGFTWSACTLHLSSDRSVAAPQSSSAYASRNSIGSNVIVAGDFNLNPGQLNPRWPVSEDVDAARIGTITSSTYPGGSSSWTALYTTVTDTSLDEKIDYVFARPTFFPNGKSGARTCDRYFTGHCYLGGWFGT